MIPWKPIAGLVLGLIAVAMILGTCRQEPGGGRSAATKRLEDSIAATQPAFVESTTVIAARETVYVARATSAATAAAVARGRAAAERQLADSLARAAQTAAEWEAAHAARKREADSLRVAADSFETAFTSERRAREEADRLVVLTTDRLRAQERINLSLSDDLDRATRRRWYHRLNITGGYGGVAGPGGRVYHGPAVTAGVCLWPCKP